MKIALLGGSFDPPHLGHYQIALHILEEKLADEVWFIPVKKHPFGKHISADAVRVKMLEILLMGSETADNKFKNKIKVNSYELDQKEVSYSYNTLEHFRKTYPDDSFSWIIGSDNLASFDKWYESEQLLKKYPVLIYPRSKYPFSPLKAGMKPLEKMPTIDISSSDIRQKVHQHQSISGIIPVEEENFIKLQHLYE
jgi:nicotinate-nucleotide adenylyltransferase